MNDFLATLRQGVSDLFSAVPLEDLVRALLILLAGWVLAALAARATDRLLKSRPLPQRVIVRRGVYFGILTIFVGTVLHQLDFELGPLFGAAGILTVALGFASQTSASNLISGLFLLTEQAFEVGDAITVGALSGEVLSIDLLSTKLRTFDNTLVRIPNESMIKTEVVVLTKFPIRRIDLELPIASDADLEALERDLRLLAKQHPRVFDEPEPIFAVLGYTDAAARVRFSVWTQQAEYFALRSALYRSIQLRLREGGVGLAEPRRRIVAPPAASTATRGEASLALGEAVAKAPVHGEPNS